MFVLITDDGVDDDDDDDDGIELEVEVDDKVTGVGARDCEGILFELGREW